MWSERLVHIIFTDFGNIHSFLSMNEKTILLYSNKLQLQSTYISVLLRLGLDVLGGLGWFGDDDEAEAGALGVERGGVESVHVCGWCG